MSERPNGETKSAKHVLQPALLHDLRSPLNHVIGYSELLLELAQEAGNEAFAPDLAKVQAAGHHLLSLLDKNFSSEIEATFVLPTLPLKGMGEARPKSEPPEASSGELPTSPLQGNLLVVDDDENNRDVLSRRLEMQGYAVDTAENGERAMEMLKDGAFDLVLLDILMAGTDGFEVLRRIKSDERLQRIPVIMISALGELDSVARCIEMGAEDYLPKPFNPTILKARIGACLERKRAHDREVFLHEQLQENFTRLQELERVHEEMTGMIVHDLRTPLTSLMAGMQTLDVVGDLNEEQHEMIAIAISGSETLLRMINDLLDVEKSEAGCMQLDYADVSASELVSSAILLVTSLAKSRELHLSQKVSPGLPTFQGDPDKLGRTLVNLLGNAIKFTPSGGSVVVAARMGDDSNSIAFAVCDTGEGIPAGAFEQIFEKFGQVEARQGGRVMSTGLGLTFCKLVVEAHGGQIQVESEPGKGSTFFFEIPHNPPSTNAEPRPESSKSSEPTQ